MKKRVYLIEVLGSETTEGVVFTHNNTLPPYPAELIAGASEAVGFEAKVLQIGGLSNNQIIERIMEFDPMVVGMTVFTHSLNRANRLAEMIKVWNPSVCIVAGGYHPSMQPECLLESKIDFVVKGEGEITFQELIGNLVHQKKSWEDIPGLAFVKNGKLVVTAQRKRVRNLDSLPWAKRDRETLMKARSHFMSFPCPEDQIAQAEISCSRGCPRNCSFCISGNFWCHKVTLRSPGNAAAEARYLHEVYGVNLLFLTDLTFNESPSRVKAICKAFIEEGLHTGSESDSRHTTDNVHWYAQCRVGIDAEMAKIMAAAGCSRVGMGVECFSETQAKIYGKPWKGIAEVEKSLVALDDAGIITRPNLVFGLPNESEKTARETIEGLKRLPVDQFRMAFVTPFPGSLMADENFILDQDLDLYDTEHPVIFGDMSRDRLIELRSLIGQEFYRSSEYAEHCRSKIARFPHLKMSFQSWFNTLARKGVVDLRKIL